MAKIKSAWEIALERTENIQIDREKLKKDENIKKARLCAGAYLNDEENKGESLVDDLKAINDDDAVKKALKLTALQNLTLASDTVLTDRYERILYLISLCCGSNQNIMELANQIVGFCKQFPEHRKQLVDQLKEQFAPMLSQKAAQLKAQYGQDVPVSLENDPEFLKIANQQLERLQKQYDETLAEAKAQLEA
ncbi:MAG: hypothetical protein PUC01_00180, partial [Spirochaetales bacterium]|nr:hypothetical protein [Spirochaetales bacterium]